MVQTSRWISLLWVVIQACQWLESLTDVILLTETEKELDGAEARTRGSALQTLQSLVSRNRVATKNLRRFWWRAADTGSMIL